MSDYCDTMWAIVKNRQTITMKMCIATHSAVVFESNYTNLTNTSLQNYTHNTTIIQNNTTLNTNNTMLNSTLLNSTLLNSTLLNSTLLNSTMLNSTLLNSTLLNSTLLNSTLLNSVVPSPSIYSIKTPSPANVLASYIRGRDISPSSSIIFNSSENNNTASNIDEESIILSISLISLGIILTFAILYAVYRRRTKSNKIHSCPPLTSHYKYNNQKNTDTNKPTINTRTERPKDYLVEQLKPLKNSTPTTQRQIPRPPSKEEHEDRDTDGKTALE